MYCPKCQQQQPDGAIECSNCGIVFARWLKAQERAGAPKPAAPRPAPGRSPYRQPPAQEARNPLSAVLKILALLVVAAGWLWFFAWAPKGQPVPQGAYRDEKNGFALSQPDGWKLQQTNDCRSSGAVMGLKKDVCIVLQLEEELVSSQARPNIQVMVAPVSSMFRTGFGGSVSIGKDTIDELAKGLEKGIIGSIPGFALESKELVKIDNLSGVKIIGSAQLTGTPMQIGDKTVMMPLGKNQPDVKAYLGAMLVSGGSTAYCVLLAADAPSFTRCSSAFDQVIESFRVTERHPTPFQKFGGLLGSVPGDAILGLLVGVTVALLKLL